MGYFVHLLKNWEKHSPLKMVKDLAEVAFNMNAFYQYRNDKEYFSDGRIKRVSTVFADVVFQTNGDEEGFIFEVEGFRIESIALGFDKVFDHLKPGGKLCSLAYIDSLGEESFEFFYRFCYEYLKINPGEYIHIDMSTRLFGWEQMQKLHEYPYDKEWLFKDVE